MQGYIILSLVIGFVVGTITVAILFSARGSKFEKYLLRSQKNRLEE